MGVTRIGRCAHCGRDVYGQAYVTYVPLRVWCDRRYADA